ncbi:MAG: hypothetical protein H8E20_03005 [Verrucomicrobia bacterium]|nr:hypothetical protein [Verrucomicrobiota bacterium]
MNRSALSTENLGAIAGDTPAGRVAKATRSPENTTPPWCLAKRWVEIFCHDGTSRVQT